jgi:hypothetical protein
MNLKITYQFFIYSLIYLFACVGANAQNVTIIIKGTVTDAQTNEPISHAGIEIVNKSILTTTNVDGWYTITLKEPASKIKISSVGYETLIKSIAPGKSQIIDVKLKSSVTTLNEVVVRPPKKKYKNKDNPAVALIDKVIENKGKNRKEGLDYYEYEKYEKIQFALSNISEKFKERKALRKFKFVFNNIDSTTVAGSKILPVYLKETLSDFYYRKSPKATKEIIKGNKMVSFEGYVDNQGMTEYMRYLYQDINIYDNNISFLSNQFLSPIATTAPTFYKYFIMDTTVVAGSKCIKLFFSPRNKTDMLFQGFLYIKPDSDYVVKKVELQVNKEINLNWVKDVNIVQEFDKIQEKGWLVTTDEISIDFGITKNSMGVFGQRRVSYKNYKVNEARGDSVYKGLDRVEADDADEKGSEFWQKYRHQQLSKAEQGVYTTIDSVKRIPAFKRTMDIILLVVSGYRDFGYFEIGPVNTFYSYNPIEGVRLRFGGRTTPKFSKKINFETYGAYGYTDNKYKGYLGATYSLTHKTIYEFPVKSLKLSVQDETKIPGQELQFIQEDNVLLSIKRGVNNKLFYNKTVRAEHMNEFNSHFSYTIGYSYTRQSPGGDLYFNPDDYLAHTNITPYINMSEGYLVLRYAPHEQFYQGKIFRVPIANKYPIFQLQYTLGSKLIGNDYNYHNLKLSISKRFYPWILGYTDVIWEAGKIFGQVPYPLLDIHRANQTYSYQITSYNLMNFLEFVSDQYASLNVDHCFNGFVFNKLPLFKKLNWREVVTCKILYGDLSNKNNPDKQTSLFKFPVDKDGNPVTYKLGKTPYIEASVGIGNIMKFFRIDLVKRLTYLDHPNVSQYGLRARFKFDF